MTPGEPSLESSAGDPTVRWQIEAALGMIAGSRWIAALSIVLAAVAALAMLLPAGRGPGFALVAGLCVLLGLAQCYFALRLAIDARLLRRLTAAGDATPALANLDRALKSLGWLPEEKAGRSLAARVQGIARLVRWQGGVTLAQALCVPMIGWMGRG